MGHDGNIGGNSYVLHQFNVFSILKQEAYVWMINNVVIRVVVMKWGKGNGIVVVMEVAMTTVVMTEVVTLVSEERLW